MKLKTIVGVRCGAYGAAIGFSSLGMLMMLSFFILGSTPLVQAQGIQSISAPSTVPVSASTKTKFKDEIRDMEERIAISQPVNYVIRQREMNKNLNGTTWKRMLILAQSEADNETLLTRYAYLDYGSFTAIFDLPETVLGKVSEQTIINYYLSGVQRSYVRSKIISAKKIDAKRGNGYEVVYEYVGPGRLTFHARERFYFTPQKVYHVVAAYSLNYPQYKDAVEDTLESFNFF